MKYFYEEWNKDIDKKNYNEKMCNYLEKELGIVVDLTEVKKIIDNGYKLEIIDTLMDFTIELCKPYVLHDYLLELNYQKCSDTASEYRRLTGQNFSEDWYKRYKCSRLQKEYTEILKEHMFSYFYYGFQVYLCKDEPKLFKDLVCNYMEYTEDYRGQYGNLVNMHRRLMLNCFGGLENLFMDQYKIMNNDRLSLPRPLRIDREVLFNIIQLNGRAPYNAMTYRRPMYTVEKMMKCLDFMRKITLHKNALDALEEDQALIFCNNYLLERIFNFDIVAHLINIYNDNIEKNIDDKQEIEDMCEKIKEIGVLFMGLPNVFSRKELMHTILNSNGSLEKKKEYLDFLIYVSFPILNLVFNFIMKYYYTLKKDRKKENPIFQELLNDHIKKLLQKPSYTMYRNVDTEKNDKITSDDITKLKNTRKKNEQKKKRLFVQQNDICHTLMQHVWENVLTLANLERINLNAFSSIYSDDDQSKQIEVNRQLKIAQSIYENRMRAIDREKPVKMIRAMSE